MESGLTTSPTTDEATNSSTEQDEQIALKNVLEAVADLESQLKLKAQLRSRIHTSVQNRPEDSYFSKLDSSIKKNTTFVRKLKIFTEAQKESILKDLAALNLTKYISEVASGIVEAKLKMTDIPSIIQVCVTLHEKYAEFSSQLLEAWHKVLSIKKDEKITNPSKTRVDVRFYADLISCGVLPPKEGLPLLGSFLTTLINSDKEEHNNASIILAFCRYCGEEYAGLISCKLKQEAERFGIKIPSSEWLPADKRQNVKNLLRDYYLTLCTHLLREHKELQNFERQNRRILQTKGELNTERKEKLDLMNQNYTKLLNTTQQFSDILDEPMPELVQDPGPKDEMECSVLEMSDTLSDQARESLNELLWENEEARQFYEHLPNLGVYLPNLIPKIPPAMTEAEQPAATEQIDIEQEAKEIEEGQPIKDEPEEDIKPAELEDDKEDADVPVSLQSNKILLDSFLTTLPNCVNREMIDSAAVDFCTNLNTKYNRKKLVRALFTVQRTRLDLLPFYSRLVATLYPYIPDIATDLTNLLKQDFKYHVRKKDQINIETKVKIARFIGELTKFGLYPRSEALHCFKLLLFNFAHHYIEMACNFIETCGRYLLHHADSHQRTKVYLEQMMRKKTMLASDSRYIPMIENAYYQVVPGDSSTKATVKVRPPLHQYIRQLLFVELGNKGATNKILKQLRKLNWKDPETTQYAIKCLTSAWKVKFPNIRTLAGVVAELSLYQEFVGHRIIDAVLEDIRWSMEVPISKFNQRRVSMVKYLAELYNYRMVESAVVFKVLYTLITFGVSFDPNAESELDPSDHLMRLRLVYTILDTCGVFFSSGLSKKRLDYYLVYLQYYYIYKKSLPVWTDDNPFPVEIDFGMKDVLATLRPKLKPYKTLQEAAEAVEKLEKELINKLEQAMPKLKLDGVLSEEALASIEEEEMDDIEEPVPMETDDMDEEQSLSQSTSHRTRGEATQPEEDTTVDEPVVVNHPRKAVCPEDDDFMAALDRMVAENIQERCKEAVKPQAVDIAIPWQVKAGLKRPCDGATDKNSLGDSLGGELGNALAAAEASSASAAALPSSTQDSNTMAFVLMTRKGNKPQFKNLAVPSDSDLALNLRNREVAERAEKERVKKLTLDFNERQEEEEFQDQFQPVNRPAVHNLNRDRRRFQHPKGVPDAELIFGGARKNR